MMQIHSRGSVILIMPRETKRVEEKYSNKPYLKQHQSLGLPVQFGFRCV
jgi:hypothetical protein